MPRSLKSPSLSSRSSRGSPSRSVSSRGSKGSKSFFESKWFYAFLAFVLLVSAVIFFYYIPVEKFTNPDAHVASSTEPHVEYFYMETCSHCKDFKAEWDKVDQKLKKEGLSVKTAEFDINKEGAGKTRGEFFGIRETPAILYVYGPQKTDKKEYNGPRTADGIVAFVKAQMTSSASA